MEEKWEGEKKEMMIEERKEKWRIEGEKVESIEIIEEKMVEGEVK